MRETYAAVFLARFGGMLIKTSREYVKYFVITDSGSYYAGTEQRRFIAWLMLTTAFFVDHASSMCILATSASIANYKRKKRLTYI